MILASFLAALGQLGDPRFFRVVLKGIGLSLLLLLGAGYILAQVLGWILPDGFTLPWVGTIHGPEGLATWGAVVLTIGLSIFLMVPVAVLFTGFFLEEVADAVEDRAYPRLGPAISRGLYENLLTSVNFFGVMVAVNLLALIGYFFVGPFAPLLFWAVNGYLLGREYFMTVALRRLDRPAALGLRRANRGTIWLAGTLMAAPLSLPFVNLVVPVLGVATFTHIFHRLAARA